MRNAGKGAERTWDKVIMFSVGCDPGYLDRVGKEGLEVGWRLKFDSDQPWGT